MTFTHVPSQHPYKIQNNRKIRVLVKTSKKSNSISIGEQNCVTVNKMFSFAKLACQSVAINKTQSSRRKKINWQNKMRSLMSIELFLVSMGINDTYKTI